MDQSKIDAFREEQRRQAERNQELDTTRQSGDKVADAVNRNTESTANGLKNIKGDVNVTNPDLAKTGDVENLVNSINALNVTTFMSASGGLTNITDNLANLAKNLTELNGKFKEQGLGSLGKQLDPLVKRLEDVSKQLKDTKLKVDDTVTSTVTKAFSNLDATISKIDWQPQINLPETNVSVPELDLRPLITSMGKVEKAVAGIKLPETKIDFNAITTGLKNVKDSIEALRFPVSNFVLPFRNEAGKADQVQLTSAGKLPVEATFTTGDIEIGAVEIKDGSTDQRASVNSNGGQAVAGDVAAAAADSGNPVKVGGKYNATQPTYADGNRGDIQIDTRGNLVTTLKFFGGTNSFLGEVDNADAVAVSATQNKLAVSSRNKVYNSSTSQWDRMYGNTSGTFTQGNIAHDGADSGNPSKIGGRAVNAEIAAVSNNDRTDFVADLTGKQIVLPYSNPENFVSGAITSAMTGTTSTSLISAPASGLRNYITQITVSNSHATVGTDIIIQDGNGGTTLYVIPAPPAYGGATITFPVPLRQPTTATAIYCANVTTGSNTKVSASGYKGA